MKKAETYFGHATESVKPVLEKLKNDLNENLHHAEVVDEEENNNGTVEENKPTTSPSKSQRTSPQKHKSREGSISPRKRTSQESSPQKSKERDSPEKEEEPRTASPQKEMEEERETNKSPTKQPSPTKQRSPSKRDRKSPQKQSSSDRESSPQKQMPRNSPDNEETNELNGKITPSNDETTNHHEEERSRSTSPNKKTPPRSNRSKSNSKDNDNRTSGKSSSNGRIRRGSSLGNKEAPVPHNNSIDDQNQVVEPEGVIEGVVNGENEVETLNEQGQGVDNSDEKSDDADIGSMVESGNMEQLAAVVLNGEGERLVGQQSDNPELQSFLENVPIYMVTVANRYFCL